MPIYRLEPTYKDYLWGGTKLREKFGKDSKDAIIAESWELSTHPDGNSIVIEDNGSKTELSSFIKKQGKSILGQNAQRFEDFPIMVKLIDAKEPLSIQVHPDEAYARQNENQHGKTEMWKVLDCDENSSIFYGPKEELSRDQFIQAIEDNTLTDLLNEVPVKKGDVFFIPSGTIHAIGSGCLIAEIQQNSNVTYRIYDYNRKGPDGKTRELHIKQAANVANLIPIKNNFDFKGHLGQSDSFEVDSFIVHNKVEKFVDDSSFDYFLVTSGEGFVRSDDKKIKLEQGNSILVTAGTGLIVFEGDMELIEVKLPPENIEKK